MPVQAAEDSLLVGSRDGKITHWNLQVRAGQAVFRSEIHYLYIAGWWFGTFFIFPYIGNN